MPLCQIMAAEIFEPRVIYSNEVCSVENCEQGSVATSRIILASVPEGAAMCSFGTSYCDASQRRLAGE